jgi:hypothetical protein
MIKITNLEQLITPQFNEIFDDIVSCIDEDAPKLSLEEAGLSAVYILDKQITIEKQFIEELYKTNLIDAEYNITVPGSKGYRCIYVANSDSGGISYYF